MAVRSQPAPLVEQLTEGAVKVVVNQWFQRVDDNRNQALAELVQLVLQAGAASSSSVRVDIEDDDHEEVIQEVQGSYEQTDGSPINSSSSNANRKSFHNRFAEFWDKVTVKFETTGLLYDEEAVPPLINWLSSICGSDLRPLRLSATIAAYYLMRGLIKSVNKLHKSRETSLKAGQKEMKKQKKNRNQDLIDQHEEEVRDADEKINVIHKLLGTTFNSVFVHRFRDVCENIRRVSIEHLGSWIREYPEGFLVDKKLAYIGWSLNDKDWNVRKAGLVVLSRLYHKADDVDRLAPFLERFIARLLEMNRDKHEQVAIEAINLTVLLLKHDLLEEDDGSNIASYMWDKSAKIREAAARFVYQDAFHLEDSPEEERYEADINEVISLLDASLLAEQKEIDPTEREVCAEYLVSSLWDRIKCLKQWKVMASMLLETDRPRRGRGQDPVLSDEKATSLVYILLACARRDAFQLRHVELPKRLVGKRLVDDESFASCLIDQLPKLLTSFQTDEPKLLALTQLVLFLDIEEFPLRRKKQALVQLLKALKSVFLKTASPELMGHVVNAHAYLCAHEYIWRDEARQNLFSLVTELKSSFTEAIEDSSSEKVTVLCLHRIVTLLNKIPTTSECFIEFDIEKIMRGTRVFKKPSNQLMILLSQMSFADITRALCRLEQVTRSGASDDEISAAAKAIVRRRNTFLVQLIKMLKSSNQELQWKSFLAVADLVSVSRSRLLLDAHADDVPPLLVDSEDTLDLMTDFMDAVFDTIEDSDGDESRPAQMRRQVGLAACKLAVLEPKTFFDLGANVISQYSRFPAEPLLNKTVKHGVAELKRLNQSLLEKMEFEAMKKVFIRTEADENAGPDALQFSKSIVTLHSFDKNRTLDFAKDAIAFVFDDVEKYADLLQAMLPWMRKYSITERKELLGYYRQLRNDKIDDDEDDAKGDDDDDERDLPEWKLSLAEFEGAMRKSAGLVAPKQTDSQKRNARDQDVDEDVDSDGDSKMASAQNGDDEDEDASPPLRRSVRQNQAEPKSSTPGSKRKPKSKPAETDNEGWVNVKRSKRVRR